MSEYGLTLTHCSLPSDPVLILHHLHHSSGAHEGNEALHTATHIVKGVTTQTNTPYELSHCDEQFS